MRLVFMGTPAAAATSLQRLVDDGHEIAAVWTQPDKPSGRGHKLHQSPVKEFALEHNLIIHQPARIKNDEAKALFASHQADAAIVVAYGRILPAEFLSAPRHGCINVHFSLLPKYRGAAPVNWAIVNGETKTGVTTMQIVAELDAGSILRQRASAISEAATAPELMKLLSGIGAELLSETLRDLENITPRPQHDDEASFAPMLKRDDGLIDWTMDASAIDRRVRGFQPWPNAHTTYKGRHVIIWTARPEKSTASECTAGQIIQAHGDDLAIACGDQTVLRLVELQPQGARRMNARDFLNGLHVKANEFLGRT